MNKFIEEIESIINTCIYSIETYENSSDRFNFIANRHGRNKEIGAYFPNPNLAENQLDIQVDHHPLHKTLCLYYLNKVSRNLPYYSLELYRIDKSKILNLRNIHTTIKNKWLQKFDILEFENFSTVLGDDLHVTSWKNKDLTIELQEVNALSKDGKISLNLIIKDAKIKYINHSLAKIQNLSIILNKIINTFSNLFIFNKDKSEDNQIKKIEVMRDTVDDLFQTPLTIYETIKKDRKLYQIDLFEDDNYSDRGFNQIYDVIESIISTQLSIPVKKIIASSNLDYKKTKVVVWKKHDHLFILSKYLNPGAYIKTNTLFAIFYNKEILDNLSEIIY